MGGGEGEGRFIGNEHKGPNWDDENLLHWIKMMVAQQEFTKNH